MRLVDRPGGQGQRLNGLLGWCQAEVAAGAWFAHGGAFYFAGPADADRFRVACGGLGVEVVDD